MFILYGQHGVKDRVEPPNNMVRLLWHDITYYNMSLTPGPLFTKKTPSYGYRDPHCKP